MDKKNVLARARKLMAADIKQLFEKSGTGYRDDPTTAQILVHRWEEDFRAEVLSGIYRMVGLEKESFERGFRVRFDSPLNREIHALVAERTRAVLADLQPEVDAAWAKMRAKAAKAVARAIEAEVENQLEMAIRHYNKEMIARRIEELAAEAASEWLKTAHPLLEAEMNEEAVDEP